MPRAVRLVSRTVTQPTATERLVSLHLDQDAAAFIADQRDRGASYDAIAAQLSERTKVVVSREAVRRWHKRAADGS